MFCGQCLDIRFNCRHQCQRLTGHGLGSEHTSSTLETRDVISSQHPQFMGYLWTLRMRNSKALGSFFSLASTMPYL